MLIPSANAGKGRRRSAEAAGLSPADYCERRDQLSSLGEFSVVVVEAAARPRPATGRPPTGAARGALARAHTCGLWIVSTRSTATPRPTTAAGPRATTSALARRRRDALARGPRRRRRLHRQRPGPGAGPDPGPAGRPVGDARGDSGRLLPDDPAPGRRRHAAAQRLAHRAGRAPHHRRRSSAEHGVRRRTAATSSSPTTAGRKPTLTVFDTRALDDQGQLAVDHAWLGLAWHPDGKRLFPRARPRTSSTSSTCTAGRLKPRRAAHGRSPAGSAARHDDVIRTRASSAASRSQPDGTTLYAVQVFGQPVSAHRSRERRQVAATADLPRRAVHAPCCRPDGTTRLRVALGRREGR